MLSGADVLFWATCLSTVVSLAALAFAGVTFRRANLNASANTHLQLNGEIRTGTERLRNATDLEEYRLALIELLRVLEIACAICNEGTLKGAARELMVDYLRGVLTQLYANPASFALINSARQSGAQRLEHIRAFRSRWHD